MLADEILQKAKRIVRLEQVRDRTVAKLEHAKREYNALIVKLESQPRPSHPLDGPTPASLRIRILEFLKGRQTSASLDQIQAAVGEARDKIIWTLANLKRSGHLLNPKRGSWRYNPDGKDGPMSDGQDDLLTDLRF